jgi:hypothetical protein
MGIDFVPYPYPSGYKNPTGNTHPSVKTTQQGNIIAQYGRKTKSYIYIYIIHSPIQKTSHIYEKNSKTSQIY